jgi:acyl carrier protein
MIPHRFCRPGHSVQEEGQRIRSETRLTKSRNSAFSLQLLLSGQHPRAAIAGRVATDTEGLADVFRASQAAQFSRLLERIHMESVRCPNEAELRSLIRLSPDADTGRSWDQLGIDSWALIELRAVLETRFGLLVPDEQWVEMTCPNDILRLRDPV